MKKKQVLITSASLALLAAMGFALALQGNSENTLRAALGGNEPYSTTLCDGTTLKSKTGLQNDINFAATSLSGGTATSLGTLAKGGTLSNTTKLTGLNKIDITMTSGSVDIYTSWDGTFTHSAVDSLIATGSVSFADTPDYFKIVAREDTVLTSVAATYACGTSVADPFTGHSISTAAELAALDNATGHYYLGNDIDIVDVIGNPVVSNFKGVLDGMGHKIYSTKEFRDAADGGIFAEDMTGAIRNLNVAINANTTNGWGQNSPFAFKLSAGAFIKDVTISTDYVGAATSAGALCCYLNGGTIKDTTINLSMPTYNTANDKLGAVSYRLSDGVVMQGVKVLTPAETPLTDVKAYATLDGSFTPDLSGLTIANDSATRIIDNPLYAPVVTGTGLANASVGTYNGMPTYSSKASYSNVWKLFDRTFDLNIYDHVRLWAKTTLAVALSGSVSTVANEWIKLDILRNSDNSFNVQGCTNENLQGFMLNSNIANNVLGNDILGFLDWNGATEYDFYSTPLYVVKEASNRVAESAFTGATAVTGKAYTEKAGLAAGMGLACFNNSLDISSYSTVRFSLFFDDIADHKAHGVSIHEVSGSMDGSFTVFSNVLGSYVLTKQVDGTWTVAVTWYNSDTPSHTTNTITGLTGTHLSDMFTHNSWKGHTGYSTPVFAA